MSLVRIQPEEKSKVAQLVEHKSIESLVVCSFPFQYCGSKADSVSNSYFIWDDEDVGSNPTHSIYFDSGGSLIGRARKMTV